MCPNSMNIFNWYLTPTRYRFAGVHPHLHLSVACLPLQPIISQSTGMTLSAHQPCNCEQLSVSKLSTWLHIIVHVSVRILSLIQTSVCQSASNCLWLNLCLISLCVLETRRERGVICDSPELTAPVWDRTPLFLCLPYPPPPLSTSLSLHQGLSVELLCGSSSVSINLDVCSAGHNRPALYTLPGEASQPHNPTT